MSSHPDADKLIICQVNIGEQRRFRSLPALPTLKKGDKVPVVLDGGRVAGGHDGKMTPGGIKIKKGKLRGVESDGMMCSIEELGSSRDMYPEAPEYGIYIFPEDAVVGAERQSRLWAWTTWYLSMRSLPTVWTATASSVLPVRQQLPSAKKFIPPVVTATGNSEDVHDYVKVTVKDTDLCPRYCARVVKNIKIGSVTRSGCRDDWLPTESVRSTTSLISPTM